MTTNEYRTMHRDKLRRELNALQYFKNAFKRASAGHWEDHLQSSYENNLRRHRKMTRHHLEIIRLERDDPEEFSRRAASVDQYARQPGESEEHWRWRTGGLAGEKLRQMTKGLRGDKQ